jgi:hypothetical protein
MGPLSGDTAMGMTLVPGVEMVNLLDLSLALAAYLATALLDIPQT